MIELKPNIDNHFICPECKSGNTEVREVLIQPVFELADCICLDCGLEFYHTLRTGHSVDEKLSIDKSGTKVYSSTENSSWLSKILANGHGCENNDNVFIERKILKEYQDVVVLNALDFLYGHVLLKLYNAQYHLEHDKDLGLIVIIPRIFEWLIPQGCAEAWIVDLKLSELSHGSKSIQSFASKQFQRFKSIYLSKAYSHPDFTTIDISKLTGIKPFDLQYFDETRPTITFILREDRWWYRTILDYGLYRLCRKFNLLEWGSWVLSLQQNNLVRETITEIYSILPNADIAVVGLGKTGTFAKPISDLRTKVVDADVEISWCKRYARSHVVVGVHGSNMLLPTAHAAGCVEILPTDRYSNLVQDISVRYQDRKQLFFYRFADQYANPGSVADKVSAIIKDFKQYNKNMCTNLYKRSEAVTEFF